MKNRISPAHLPAICTAFLLALSLNAFAQKTVVWRGGTPGQETNWHCPKNWSTHTVPDAFADVVIPDVSTTTRALPEIRIGKVEINSLTIAHSAGLSLGESAQLIVLDNTEGIEINGFRHNHHLMATKGLRQ